jgi:hypothetical protein
MNPYHMRHAYSSLLPGTLEKFSPLHHVFVETGTNIGQGIEAALTAGFPHIISIEFDPALYREVYARYGDNPRVTLWSGNSADVLTALAPRMTLPHVIYLDAHSIEYNPLLKELEALDLSPCKDHVLLVDDVRMFGTPDWHHITIDEALSRIYTINSNYKISFLDTAHAPDDLLVAQP